MNVRSRKSIRLTGYDYAQPRAYFITISTNKRACVFGDIVDGRMKLSNFGQIAQDCWNEIPSHFLHIKLDEFIIMPNHIHGIVIIDGYVGAQHAAPLHEQVQKSVIKPGGIPAVVRSFKSAVTKRVREMSGMRERVVWQRNYYDNIVRSDQLNRIRQYIINNPSQRNQDLENLTPVLIEECSASEEVETRE